MPNDVSSFNSAYAFFTGQRAPVAAAPAAGAGQNTRLPRFLQDAPAAGAPAPVAVAPDSYNNDLAKLEQQIARLQAQLQSATRPQPTSTTTVATPPFVPTQVPSAPSRPVITVEDVAPSDSVDQAYKKANQQVDQITAQVNKSLEHFNREAERVNRQMDQTLPQITQQINGVVGSVNGLIKSFSDLFGHH